MKKILVSILMIGSFAIPASAKIKSKAKRASGRVSYASNPAIDHSKDVAYSARWADQAQSPARDVNFGPGANESAYVSPLRGKTYYYDLKNFTYYAAYPVSMNGPYQGKDAPSYDGVIKNKYRNMRASNESEPLPPNNGGK